MRKPSAWFAARRRRRLQWGRNMIVAEGRQRLYVLAGGLGSSMGPQHDSCGRQAGKGGERERVASSMGPQHDSCGRRGSGVVLSKPILLQWGRNMIVAEGRDADGTADQRDDASMGPQHDSCGRLTEPPAPSAQQFASMGPQHDSCGRRRRRLHHATDVGFNGAAT